MSKIEFSDMSFGYSESGEHDIVKHASFSFDSDRITVLTGPSGCGKSTVLYLAAGIYPQNAGILKSGKILVSDQEISGLPPDRRCDLAGLMFQNPDLQFCMDTVENEIMFCLGNICTPRNAMDEIARASLEACGISHLRNRMLQSLSGGEKQKAMLACLIALRPRWLLLDEPFANIDDESANELIRIIVRLHRENTGVIVVDHRLDYWLPVADEIRLMDPKTGIGHTGYSPAKLSPDGLTNMGILPPGGHYRRPPGTAENKGLAESVLQLEQLAEPALQLDQLTLERGGRTILNKVSFKFQRGKIYALLGRSGCGKSSLFHAINGLYQYKGEILLNGKDIRRRGGRKAGAIGFVTQNAQDQFVADTVREEIEVSLNHRKVSLNHRKVRLNHRDVPNDTDENVESVLQGISLWSHRNVSPYMLSQGQQRRLGVSALLLYDCELLICDEPAYAQDRDNTAAVMDALTGKAKERGITLIFSTHDRKLAGDYADVILELEEGNLYERSKSDL